MKYKSLSIQISLMKCLTFIGGVDHPFLAKTQLVQSRSFSGRKPYLGGASQILGSVGRTI